MRYSDGSSTIIDAAKDYDCKMISFDDFLNFLIGCHCVKSVRIRTTSGPHYPHFPGFGLNTER